MFVASRVVIHSFDSYLWVGEEPGTEVRSNTPLFAISSLYQSQWWDSNPQSWYFEQKVVLTSSSNHPLLPVFYLFKSLVYKNWWYVASTINILQS